MAGLASETIGVVVEFILLLVGSIAVTRLTGGGVAIPAPAADQYPLIILGGGSIAAAADIVRVAEVTDTTGEVEPFGIHMDIEIASRLIERAIQIAMLYRIAAAIEVAGTTTLAAGLADATGNLPQIGGLADISRVRREFHILIVGMAGESWNFFVFSGGVVTGKAINIRL